MSPKSSKIPCKFPASREFEPETGPIQTASSAKSQRVELFTENGFILMRFFGRIWKWTPPAIWKFCAALFFQLPLRQEMRKPLACRGKCAPHRLLGIAAIGLRGLVSRESAALTLGQLGFLQLGHAAVPTGIEREKLRHPLDLLAQRLHSFSMPG
jgi:hypothetical protein